MRYLIDACVHQALFDELSALGADVIRIPTDRKIPDPDVLALAFAEQRVVITNDKGFGDLVLRKRHPCAGAILIRIEIGIEAPSTEIAQSVLALGDQAIRAFSTLDGSGIRTRKL